MATEFNDEMVLCGHCNTACKVPQTFGPGIVIDDFALIQLAGQGGMGDVYLSHQFSLDRTVALKILKQQFAQDVKFMEEFVREARSVASLNHPNIIQAYKVGEDSGYFFFAMEFVEGRTLADIMKDEGVLDQAIAIEVMLEMTRALGYAWDQCKLVHRDIKPENIMVTNDGTSKLMDMGLSRKAEDTADDSDTISGTPQYISPEQIVGNEMDIRGDFYSLGATMFHLLTGRFVFEGTLDEMIHKHVSELPISARKVNPTITKELSKVLSRLLGKLPEDRYQTAKDLEKDLLVAQKALEGGGNTNKKKKLFTVKSVPDNPGTTSKNLALKTDKNKAARTGRNRGVTQSLSKTNKNKSATGRNRGVGASISKPGGNKSGSTGKQKSINTGKHPAVVTTTTGNIRRRDRGERSSSKDDKKNKNKKPLIIGGAIAGLILLIIIIAAASGGEEASPVNNNSSTSQSNNSSNTTTSVKTPSISAEEKALIEDPNFMKAETEKFKVYAGLKFKYYEQKFNSVKDIEKSNPTSTGNYHTFSLDNKKRRNDFAFIYEGYVLFPKTAKYKIYLGSDDGSRLFLDDKEIINNDGSHGFEEKSADVILEKGMHKFKLEYFQGGSDMGLDVEIEYPGLEKTTIPRRWLYRRAN
ncbi:MAG: protein kinase [Lentisphaeraceae bacterium]|nr:protein kinase [Lentisphaeraceae bacterium]